MQNNPLTSLFTLKKRVLILMLFFCCFINSNAQNLITNGDFGIFNASITNPAQLGYQSNYTQISYNSGNSVPRQYAISNNSKTVNPTNFKTLFDHTTGNGTGNMMVVDGDGNEIFWKQSSFALIAGTTYTFSYWVINVNNVTNGLNPAPKILFNPTDQCGCTATLVSGNGDLALMGSGWQQVVYTFMPTGVAGTTKYVRIELSTISAGGGGNDFAIDDISLTEPLNISSVNSSNVSCPQGNDGVIAINVSGGMAPYTYKITGTSTSSNLTGVFALGAGTYTVSVTDSKPTTVNYPTPIIITAPADNLAISPSSKTICAGEIVPLVASGGYGNYVWSSDTSALIAGLSSTSGSNVNATPTATTKYTLTSDNGINGAELITNGGFESGVIAPFTTTGYTLKAGSTGTSSAGQYKISGTSLDLSTDFKWGCVPHSGNKMFMADSPTSANTILEQTVTVVPGVNYQLSYFIQSLGVFSGPTEPSPAVIEVFINGVSINKSTNSNTACSWREIKTIWNSGVATSATITLKDINFTGTGNDFALDDISFKGIQCTVSKSITLTVSPGTSDTAFTYPTPVCQSATSFTPIKTNSTTFTSGGTWSKFSGTGTLSIDSNTGVINPSLSTAGTYIVKYEVLANAAICQSAGSTTFSITINPLPTIVSTVPNDRCGSGTVNLSATASSGTAVINWYSNSTGGTSLTTGLTFTTPSISSNTTYYVDATENGCTSTTRTAILATVNTIPTIATTTPNSRCGTGTITLNATASAGIVNWYATPTGGISLGTGTSFTTLVISSDTTYYLDATLGTCTTASRIPILATVNTIPVLVISCGTSSGTSVQFNWNTITDATNYSYSYTINGGSPITSTLASTTTTLTVNGLTPGQTVAITVTPVGSLCGLPANGNCVSSNCLSPTVNQVSNFPVCVNGIIPAISFVSNPAGATISWACNNTSIGSIGASGTGTIPTFTAANVATQQIATITVTANNGFCTGPAMTFDIIVNPLPNAPTLTPTQPSCTLATGSIAISPVVGETYSFDLNAYSATLSYSGLTASSSHTVTAKNAAGCISPVSTLILNAQPATPNAPTLTPTQPTCTLATGSIAISSVVGETYSFDLNAYSATLSYTSLVAGSTHTVTAQNAEGCISSASTHILNAQPATPNAPTLTPTQPTCTLATGSIAISSVVGETYSFDLNAYSSNLSYNGLVAGSTHTVTAQNAAGCISSASTLILNVQPVTPTAPTLTPTQPTCTLATGSIAISPVVGETYSFDSGSYSANLSYSGLAASSSHTVTAQNAAGCISSASTIILNAQPAIPTAPTLTPTQPTCILSTGSIAISPIVGETYSFDSGSYSATLSYTSLLAGSTHTVTAQNAAGCISSASTIILNAQPAIPTAPTLTPTQPTCTLATGSIAISPIVGETYSFDSGAYSATLSYSGLIAGSTHTVTAQNAAGCISLASTIILNAQPAIPSTPILTADQPTCANPTGVISVATVSGMTYSFDSSPYSLTLVYTGLPANSTHTVTAQNVAGCISSVASIILNSQPVAPIALATPSLQSICSTSAPSIALSSNTPGTVFNWNVVQTNVTGASAGSGNTINQILTTVGNRTGEAVYSVVPSLNGCQGTPILVTITVNPIPVATANPSLATICSGTATSIALTSNVAGATFSWAAIQSGVIGATSGIGNTIAQTLSTAGIVPGTVTYTLTPIINGCAGLPITATVTVNPTPEVFGSAGTTICSGESSSILLSPNIPGTQFAWTVVQTNVLGAVAGTGDTIDQILEADTVAGTAVYTVTPSLNGCSGNSIKITINVNPAPTPAIATGIICVDAVGTTLQTYTLDTNLSNANYTFEWYWNSALINGAVVNTYEATKEGNYSVIVTNKITGCISKEAFATIIVNNPATSLDAFVSDAFTQEATVTASVQGGTGPFLYQIDGGEFQSSNEFSGLSSGTHTLTVKDAQGCTNLTKQVTVIDYPKYFTPNGDGYDETWNIKGLSDQPNARIFIFDRYGKLIKEISTQGSGWDGTYNSKQLPATDYWFTVEYEENTFKLFKAHFSLKR